MEAATPILAAASVVEGSLTPEETGLHYILDLLFCSLKALVTLSSELTYPQSKSEQIRMSTADSGGGGLWTLHDTTDLNSIDRWCLGVFVKHKWNCEPTFLFQHGWVANVNYFCSVSYWVDW